MVLFGVGHPSMVTEPFLCPSLGSLVLLQDGQAGLGRRKIILTQGLSHLRELVW